MNFPIFKPKNTFFWGEGHLSSSDLELMSNKWNSINCLAIFIPDLIYILTRRQDEKMIPTFSYILTKRSNKYIFSLLWFYGYFYRLFILARKRKAKGLTITLLAMLVSWIGAQINPIKDEDPSKWKNKHNKKHYLYSSLGFTIYGIMYSYFCRNNSLSKKLFTLLLTSIPFSNNQNLYLFSILEHLCIYHVTLNTYPIGE